MSDDEQNNGRDHLVDNVRDDGIDELMILCEWNSYKEQRAEGNIWVSIWRRGTKSPSKIYCTTANGEVEDERMQEERVEIENEEVADDDADDCFSENINYFGGSTYEEYD